MPVSSRYDVNPLGFYTNDDVTVASIFEVIDE